MSFQASGSMASAITFCPGQKATTVRAISLKLKTGTPKVKNWRGKIEFAGKMIKTWPQAFPGIWAAEADRLGLSPQQVYTSHFLRNAGANRYILPTTGIPMTRLASASLVPNGTKFGKFMTLWANTPPTINEAFRIWVRQGGTVVSYDQNWIRTTSDKNQGKPWPAENPTGLEFWSIWSVGTNGMIYTATRVKAM